MKIDLLPLINNVVPIIDVNQNIEISKEYFKTTDIRELSTIKILGTIDNVGDYIYSLKLNAKGIMILPCALSLENVDYPFEINIDETIGNSEDFEENYKIISNTLDILPILWENIVLEIPNRVVKDNVKIKESGDGWCLTGENELKTENQLSELKQLLDMEGKK